VWTWEVPLYLFVGGTAGMAGVIAWAARAAEASLLVTRAALIVAAAGAIVSPLLLTLDLGRPWRFVAMLRVFKARSAMSVGAWTLAAFGAAAVPAAGIVAGYARLLAAGVPPGLLKGLLAILLPAVALLGAVLAAYPGVLLAATAVPAWASHRSLLPLHYGLAGLGSAAAILELSGLRLAALAAIGLGVAVIETAIGARIELRRLPVIDEPLHRGRSGWMLRVAGVLAGPAALALRLADLVPAAAVCFLLGALISRYGWIEAGRWSALDPAAAFAPQEKVPGARHAARPPGSEAQIDDR
jgi:hypothetical protein